MAVFSVKCPACGKSITCDDEWRGMNLECPYCKQTFTIPSKETHPKQSSSTKKSESSEAAVKDSFQYDEKRKWILYIHYILSAVVLLGVVIVGVHFLFKCVDADFDYDRQNRIQRESLHLVSQRYPERYSSTSDIEQGLDIDQQLIRRDYSNIDVKEHFAELSALKEKVQGEKMQSSKFLVVAKLVFWTVIGQILASILLHKMLKSKSIIRSDSLYPTGRIYIFLHYVEIYLCFAVGIPAMAIITLLGVITLWAYFASFSSMLFIAFMLLLSANILRAFFDVADNSFQVKDLLKEALVSREEQQ